MILIVVIATLFLAYSNGANDNFKGVATLFGSNTFNYKKAINWATITTFAGSLAAIFLANALIQNFSGKGLVSSELFQLPIFAISVCLGAALTVFIATKAGMPISTTHGLVGALFGTGIITMGYDFNFSKLGSTFLIPLLISPLIAATISYIGYISIKFLTNKAAISKGNCLCLNETEKLINVSHFENNFVLSDTALKFKTCENKNYNEAYEHRILGITIQKIIDFLHFISAGIVSFARGLNDTPKIVGLLILINTIDVKIGMILIGVTMAIGGLLNAKKVGITMSKKITPMTSGQGLVANLVTGLLVTTSSFNGLPVSTTHVSVGSIFGIGSVTKKADLSVISKIILSWVLTLPIAAIFSAITYKVLEYFI